MLGEAAVGSVEDEVVLMDAGGDGFGAEFFQEAEEGFGVGDAELDFGFAGHEGIVMEEEGYQISDIRNREGERKMGGKTRGLRSFSYPCRTASG